MEWIASLDFEKIANAIVILLVGFLSAFGFRRGKAQPDAPAASAPHVEVAGALVDSSSIKMLAGELAGQTIALTAQTAAIRDQTEELEEGRHSTNRLREAIDRLAVEMARRQ
ncbi:hypothetical protein [Aureimonas sp. ME7]|uniref:hypothetical protein n=1 Tax=Aureimonas sp. ME7 TaxID=2744252 RepID=UPI0015F6C9D7|nr:hypothetical protein [Aureimonas sp. ME7]